MNDNARRWVTALRSDRFKQGTGALHTGVGPSAELCCLGVACVLACEAGVPLAVETHGAVVSYDEFDSVLPPVVQDWLGLNHEEGGFGDREDGDALTTMNDSGCTFAEIANVIESEPEGLFR